MNAFPVIFAAIPLVDIDGTMLIQFGLFAALYFVLQPLLFKPWIQVLERREARIGGAIAEALTLQHKVEALEQDCVARLDKTRENALLLRSDLRSKTESEQSDLLAKAREEAARGLDQARSNAKRESSEARRELQSKVDIIASDVVLKVLGRSA